MSSEPLVSIITPCYNSSEYLERYFTSILSQTYSNIELILINDGSTDNTEEIISRYQNTFEENGLNIVYVYQENRGLGGAINTGLKYISGEYFTWCDSDNFFSTDYVERKVQYFQQHPEYSVVRCDGNIVMNDNLSKVVGTMSKGVRDRTGEHLFYAAIDEKNFHFGCAMIKTSDFDSVVPSREIYESRVGQNWQLLLPVLYQFRSGYIDLPLFTFVDRKESITGSINQDFEKIINRENEFEKILLQTISGINIPNVEMDALISRIKTKYCRRKMLLYALNVDAKNVSTQYQNIKSYTKPIISDKLIYLFGKINQIHLLNLSLKVHTIMSRRNKSGFWRLLSYFKG